MDKESEPASDRKPLTFTEIYLGHVDIADFRKNGRGELDTGTATFHTAGIAKLIFVSALFQYLRGFIAQRPG